ncbi:MAG: ROK family protein [Gammaproteobacteria bacterium]|nr:ROK family protein [Gammaproteobacteria bacterium]NIR82091.1 ROK family protein [Gammaproteobacteria bacterium]NIR89324.1 ROK family protein [Gammaproteobacteria bacterium]NIU03201.1 ROK family protein [Gammaproteobacteria bacterium]NIV50713.1 ROK family protein [Gammaproteobacteria bacterium]
MTDHGARDGLRVHRHVRIGVDLGGTKIEAAAFDGTGRTLSRRRVSTPRKGYEALIAAIVDLVRELERDAQAVGSVGVGTPGAISPASGRIKNANSTILIGRRLHEDLARALGREVRMSNDANCFALSEAVDGAAAGAEVVFGVIVGTGTGAGIVVRGRTLTGINAIAGEWGHNPMPWPQSGEWPGPPCYCGRTGCLETFLSGPALSRDLEAATGRRLEPPQIEAAAAAGDREAEACLLRYESRMARGLAHVINILDPDVIVLGGGMSHIARLYENVPRLWDAYVFSDRVATRLVPPRHGDASGVRGAAWLWPPQ